MCGFLCRCPCCFSVLFLCAAPSSPMCHQHSVWTAVLYSALRGLCKTWSCEFRVFCYFFEIKISSQRSACSPAHVSRISVFSQRGHCTLRTFSGERTTLFEFVVFAHDTQSARWYKPRSGWQPVQTSGCSLECPPHSPGIASDRKKSQCLHFSFAQILKTRSPDNGLAHVEWRKRRHLIWVGWAI